MPDREPSSAASTPERACGSEEVHGPHEWLAGVRRVQCWGVVPPADDTEPSSAASDWERDHRSADGTYDAAMWGDPAERSSAASGRDALYAVTEEMAARAQDPRCPHPLALLIIAWVNALNKGIAEVRDAD